MPQTRLQPPPQSSIVAFFLQTRYLRVLGQRIFPVYTATTPDGVILHLRSRYGFDAATVEEVIYKRIYERFFSPGPGETVIDVGAHIGSFTVMAAREVGPSGKVVSLEPSAPNFKLLNLNISTNHFDNAKALNLAAGSTDDVGELRLYNRQGGNSFYSRELPLIGSQSVKITTLDSVAESLKLDRIDFVKIDVEGHELEVLKGASEILGEDHPKIVLETHEFGPSVEDLTGYLEKFNYSVKTTPYGSHLGLLYAS